MNEYNFEYNFAHNCYIYGKAVIATDEKANHFSTLIIIKLINSFDTLISYKIIYDAQAKNVSVVKCYGGVDFKGTKTKNTRSYTTTYGINDYVRVRQHADESTNDILIVDIDIKITIPIGELIDRVYDCIRETFQKSAIK